MKRGPLMPRGIELAVPVALRRGHVGVFIRSLVNNAELLITGNGRFVLVGVRYARKFCACIADIEAEFAEVIAMLRLVPRTGPVSCELWLYSRYDTLRHFRIDDAGLVELDAYGTPLDELKQAAPLKQPDGDAALVPGAAPAPVNPAPATPAPAYPDNRGPVLRWLAKWNAARLAGKSVDEMEGSRLRNILDAVRPARKRKPSPKKKPVTKNPAGTREPEEKKISPGDPVAGKNSGAMMPGPEILMTAAEGNPSAQDKPSMDLPPGPAPGA